MCSHYSWCPQAGCVCHTTTLWRALQQLLEAEGVSIDLLRGYRWDLGDQTGGSPGPCQRLGYNTLGALGWQDARMDPWESGI